MESAELVAYWQPKIHLVRRKQGRTLTTVILHVEGAEEPPLDILFRAANDWQHARAGQVVRRPDEAGQQVYWLNYMN